MAKILGEEKWIQHPWWAGQTKILCARYVPISIWTRITCRTSRRLYGYGYLEPLQTQPRLQCTAPNGLGCLWSACRTICTRHRKWSSGIHKEKHWDLPSSNQFVRLQLWLESWNQHDRPWILQVDPMDLYQALWKRVSLWSWSSSKLGTRAWNCDCQWRSHWRQERTGRLWCDPQTDAPMDAENHGICWSFVGRFRRSWLARKHQRNATQLDRTFCRSQRNV